MEHKANETHNGVIHLKLEYFNDGGWRNEKSNRGKHG